MEYDARYPLCQKYDVPIISGTLLWDDKDVWLKSLPYEWADKFEEVLGQVTCGPNGLYAVDIEDTLAALEQGSNQRGGF